MYHGSSTHKQINSQKEVTSSEVTVENAQKCRIFFHSFFHSKQRNQLACYVKTNCLNVVKIYNRNNKSDINVKHNNPEMVANLKRTLPVYSAVTAPQVLYRSSEPPCIV
jgi:transcriptional regulator